MEKILRKFKKTKVDQFEYFLKFPNKFKSFLKKFYLRLGNLQYS